MLDIKFIKENKDIVKEAARKKRIDFDVDELIKIDEERLVILSEVESLRAEQNIVSKEVPSVTDPVKRGELIEKMKVLKEDLQTKEQQLKEILAGWQKLMVQVPNIPDASVPEGNDDSDNKEFKVWGDKPVFDFEAKNHIDLMMANDLVDFERGVKVAGFRGYFLKNEAALLSFALWRYSLDLLTQKGYTPLLAPSLVNKQPFLGTGYLPQGEEDLYQTQDGDYLTGTAEVGTMGYYMDEVVDYQSLPIKFVSFSPCFRREAGSHGKDTKGLIRVHEFYKVEQVVLCEASHEQSVAWHETLTKEAETLMQNLKLPYRVVVNSTGDLGLGQVKKYDIEVWVPSENKYRETHSISYFHDFQTRRLNTRYRDEEGKLRFVHSLNGTMAATPRLLAAVIENYQQADGSILIPEVLKSYLGQEVIKKN